MTDYEALNLMISFGNYTAVIVIAVFTWKSQNKKK